MKSFYALFAGLIIIAGSPFVPALSAQDQSHDHHANHDMQSGSGEHHHAMPNGAGMDHGSMDHSSMNSAGMFLMGQSSGTGFQPSAWPMPMLMSKTGDWNLMWMGQAFIVNTQQSGPRGGDKLYSGNWGMLSAIHKLGGGSFMLRSMLSLEPATVTNRSYPVLFQTGETAYGRPWWTPSTLTISSWS